MKSKILAILLLSTNLTIFSMGPVQAISGQPQSGRNHNARSAQAAESDKRAHSRPKNQMAQQNEPEEQDYENQTDPWDTWHFNSSVLKDAYDANNRLKKEDCFKEVNITSAVKMAIPAPEEAQEAQEIILTNEFITSLINKTPEENGAKEQIAAQMNQLKNNAAKIKGLFLERPNARATIIFTPGFLHKKENLAPFVKIAPNDLNLLFIELAGIGESQAKSSLQSMASLCGCGDKGPGPAISLCGIDFPPQGGLLGWLGDIGIFKNIKYLLSLKTYGLNEYNDIIGAISFVNEKTNGKPIIVFGLCAGAIHTTNALINLRKTSPTLQQMGLINTNNALEHFNVKGLVFDSGFASFKDILPNLKDYAKKKFAPCLFSENTNDSNQQELNSGLSFIDKITGWISKTFKIVTYPAKKIAEWATSLGFEFIFGVGDLFFKNSFIENDDKTKISDKIQEIKDVPTLFIHSKEDPLSPINNVEQLFNCMDKKYSQFWKVDGKHHTTIHFNFKQEYKQTLDQWLNKVIGASAAKSKNENNKNQEKEKTKKLNPNIKRMIEIIDSLITIFNGLNQNNQKQQQKEIQNLIEEFNTLLNDPKSNIPKAAKATIEEKLAKMPECKSQDEIISNLKEIKNILLNLENIKENNKDAKGKQNNNEKNNNNSNNNNKSNDYNNYDNKQTPSIYNNPENKNNSLDSGNKNGNRNYGYNPSSSGSNGNGSNGQKNAGPNMSRQSPGSHSRSNGSGYPGGYGDGYNGPGRINKEDEKNQVSKPIFTESEYMLLDHDEPEFEDEPDDSMPFWMRMCKRG